MRTTSSAGIAMVLLLAGAAQAQQYVISTVAGATSPPPASPVPALSVSIGSPNAVTTDVAGNVFFASSDLNSVYKLDPGGALTRVAGYPTAGYSGDGGPAASARLLLNVQGVTGQALAVDAAGNLFIADTGNNRVRRVSPDGIIATVVGNGGSGFAGDGGPAVSAMLSQPSGVAVDAAGNLFIAGHHTVRKVSPAGIITTVAGTGVDGFSGDGGPAVNAELATPRAVAVDGAGNLFIADSGNARLRKVAANGIITTLAGNETRAFGDAGTSESGPATSISLDWISTVALDRAGNVYIADGRVRKISPGGMLTTVTGTGTPGLSAAGVVVDGAGNLVIADEGNRRIRKISPSGTTTTVAGDGTPRSTFSGDGGPATSAQLRLGVGFTMAGVAVNRAGDLFFADTGNHRIRKVSNGTITTVAGVGVRCSTATDCLPLGDGGPAASAALSYPVSLALDGAGNLFIDDAGSARIRKISRDGIISTVAPLGGWGYSGGLAADATGNLFVAVGIVQKIAPDGTITTVAGGGPRCEEGGINCPPLGDGGWAINARLTATAVAVDRAGNLFIADNQLFDTNCEYRIRKVSPDGIISTVAGTTGCDPFPSGDGGPAVAAHLGYTSGIAMDAAGYLFIADLYNGHIRRVSSDGVITTVAGDGWGFGGDGGPATSGTFTYPGGVALDGEGNVFVSDLANNAIRMLQPAQRFFFITAVQDAASLRADPIAPGKIVVIYGLGLGPTELIRNEPANGRYSTSVGGTAVSVNGVAAPVLYTSSTQVAAIVPYSVTGATASVTVTYNGEESSGFTVPVEASAPSLFTLSQRGSGHAAAINQDGTTNTAANPVKIGAYVSLYATGGGQTAPAGVDGMLGDATVVRPVLPVSATVGGIPAVVQYAGSAPGQAAGMMQVNVQIPSGVQPGGYVPVVLKVGDRSSSPAVWIAVSGN